MQKLKPAILVLNALAVAATQSIIAPQPKAEAKDSTPTVLELFTSEGCSSCPSADALLSALARRNSNNMIVLSEHVDYWNYLGWKDPHSSPVFSERQKHYVSALHSSSVYTPQLVINGSVESVGNNPEAVEQALTSQSKSQLSTLNINAIANSTDQNVTVEFDSIPEMKKSPFVVNIAFVRDFTSSRVTRGENQGRTLTHTNVVTKLISLNCAPTARRMKLSVSGDLSKERMIVFLQKPQYGQIFAVGVKPSVRISEQKT
ncbi:MAG TPA: DUF1223 domain-containing protein [Drouetiella sp.]|jgi:hypothetical protein